MRGFNATILAEIAKRRIATAHLIKIDWGIAGPAFYTDSRRDITFDGDVYQASGDFLDFSAPPESMDITSTSITINISGAAQINLQVMLTEKVANTPVTLSRVLLDDSLQVIDDPFVLFFGFMDNFEFNEDPESGDSEVTWNVSSHWIDFERTRGRRTNDTDQQKHFPGDKGFEFAPIIKENIKWGAP